LASASTTLLLIPNSTSLSEVVLLVPLAIDQTTTIAIDQTIVTPDSG